MSESLLTDETMSWIGRETGPGEPYTIEPGMIRQFAQAIQDENPLYWDEKVANKSVYSGVPMPPAYLLTNVVTGSERNLQVPVWAERRIRGGDELIVYKPLKAGETVRANTRVESIEEKVGSTGPMVFITTLTQYTDEAGEVRMEARTTIIKR